jgi:hypothetical protein
MHSEHVRGALPKRFLIFVAHSGFTLNGMKVFGCKTAQVCATHRERWGCSNT